MPVTTQEIRPIWFLTAERRPVKASDKKRVPEGATHWCCEGDERWEPISDSRLVDPVSTQVQGEGSESK